MPQENKKRGRRMKRKHEAEEDSTVPESSKRRKSSDVQKGDDLATPLVAADETLDAAYLSAERPFFGMLDAEEQEGFKCAFETLEEDAFPDEEERQIFLTKLFADIEGMELKIAQSQGCSRLMEKLIQLSTPAQLKRFFQAFSGNFIHLVSHRFASHCCEALFSRAAPVVTEELLAPNSAADSTSADDVYVSMENLFLHTLAEFEGSIGFLMTDQYGSHALRVLLLVFAGEPLDAESTKRLLQSKRKEGTSVEGLGQPSTQPSEKARAVPKSFTDALEKLMVESVAGLDTDKLRTLATHPLGNPTLQLLLKLELTHFGKSRSKNEKSIVRTLLPDDPITSDSGSAAFISGLVYDAVGSHLVEQVVQHAPGRMFKSLNRDFFKERLASLARNEIAGHVVCRVLERMSQDDLYDAHEKLIPIIPSLLERGRTKVILTLIERCAVRDIDTTAIAAALDSSIRNAEGFDVKELLKLEQSEPEPTNGTPHDSVQSSASESSAVLTRPPEPAKLHFNLLAQGMLRVPGPLSALVLDSLICLEVETLLRMVKDPIISHTIQAALISKSASIMQKRKLITHFYGSIGDLALDKFASHVVDCIWEGTHGLAFIRERIAEELAENESQLRESPSGRAVWKNWKMDIYKRRRLEWIRQSKEKASNDGFQSFAELDSNKQEQTTGDRKTPLQLARERHAAKKEKQGGQGGGRRGNTGPGGAPASGANAAPTTAASG